MRHVQLIFFLAALAPALASADLVSDWTHLGYYVLAESDGTYISRHVDQEEAYKAASWEAYQRRPAQSRFLIYPPVPPAPPAGEVGFEFAVVEPPPDPGEPPEPPDPPPPDNGDKLDPNTVFVCDRGELGGTIEPTGDDSNTGLFDENGVPQPVLTLKRFMEIAESRPDGVDYALCEGGIWERQQLVIRKSGDVGEENRVHIRMYEAQQAAARPGGSELYYWAKRNLTPEVAPRLWTNDRLVPGFDWRLVDRVMVHGYKLLNGVPRPLADPKSICTMQGDHACYDPFTSEYWESGWPG